MPKAFAILRHLTERSGELVTQDDLLDAVWGETHVQPDVLKRHIVDVRKILGDSPKAPQFIETVSRRGYRFVAAVERTFEWESSPPQNGSNKLVGRTRELADLKLWLSGAIAGLRQIVFVSGETGIGKTALVDTFQRKISIETPRVRMARGQCTEGYGDIEPYYPMLEALSELCRGAQGDGIVQTLVDKAPTWVVQLPALLKRRHRHILQRDVLGATRERMLREINEALEEITKQDPLLLVFEDIQWIDRSTIDLISSLSRRRGPMKLMLIATYRSADVVLADNPLESLKRDLVVQRLCREIALESLGERQVGEYLSVDSAGGLASEDLIQLVYQYSEGNPLFMVSVVEHMAQRGLIFRTSGVWHLRGTLGNTDPGIPESLRRMVELQIDRLSLEERRILEAASVSGMSFQGYVASIAKSADQNAFEDACNDLARRHQMLRMAEGQRLPNGVIAQRYEFIHALYREVLYRMLSPAQRTKLHQGTGQALEAIYVDQLEDVAPELAHHFEQSSDWPRTIKYLLMTAEISIRRYAHRDAAMILERALSLTKWLAEPERSTTEIQVLERLAMLNTASYDASALKSYEALAERAALYGLVDVEVRAHLGVAYALSWTDSQRCLEALARCLRLVERQTDPLTRLRTRLSCFFWRLWAGGWNARDMQQYCQLFDELQNNWGPVESAYHRIEYGVLQWASSQYLQAKQGVSEAIVTLFEANEQTQIINLGLAHWGTQLVQAWALLFCGEWGVALEEINKSIALLVSNGEHYRAYTLRLYQAWVHLHAMDFEGVITLCQPEVHWTAKVGSDIQANVVPQYPAEARICLILAGTAAVALGRYDEASRYLATAADNMNQRSVIIDWYWKMPLEAALTDLWLAQGSWVKATEHANRFLQAVLQTEERTWHALGWEANARVAFTFGDLKRAQVCADASVVIVGDGDLPLASWKVYATAAHISKALQQEGRGEEHLAQSIESLMLLSKSLESHPSLQKVFLSSSPVAGIIRKS